MSWRGFTHWFIGTAVTLFAGFFLFIAIIDPMDILPFSPKWHRRHLFLSDDSNNLLNDQYTVSAMSKRKEFNAALFGNSTAFILHPILFQRAFPEIKDMRMVNLAMRAGLPYEQYLTARRFLHYHKHPKMMVFTISQNWCSGEKETLADPGGPIPAAEIPAWLFSPNPFAAYSHIFSLKMLRNAWVQYQFLRGKRNIPATTYERNGNSQELNSDHTKDKKEVMERIYGPLGKREKAPQPATSDERAAAAKTFEYKRVPLMADLINRIPTETMIIFIFMPEHYFFLPPPDSIASDRLNTCKDRFIHTLATHPHSYVVDFMRDTPITRDDSVFWDGNHFGYKLGNRMPELVARAIHEQRSITDVLEYRQLRE